MEGQHFFLMHIKIAMNIVSIGVRISEVLDYWGFAPSKAKSSNQALLTGYCMQSPQDYYKPLDMPNKERFTLFGFCFPGAKILQSPVKGLGLARVHCSHDYKYPSNTSIEVPGCQATPYFSYIILPTIIGTPHNYKYPFQLQI